MRAVDDIDDNDARESILPPISNEIILTQQSIEAEDPAPAPPIEEGMGNFNDDGDDDDYSLYVPSHDGDDDIEWTPDFVDELNEEGDEPSEESDELSEEGDEPSEGGDVHQ